MIRFFLVCYALICLALNTFAQPGDTTIVQTFTHAVQNNPNTAYDSPGRRWFQFPPSDNGLTYQKILMYYNLKCFTNGSAGNLGYPCGEWDYLTYSYLYDHTGVLDSTSSTHPIYKVNNFDFSESNLTSQPAFITRQYTQSAVVIDEMADSNTTYIGIASLTAPAVLTTNMAQRSLFLYRADELIEAGLQAGQEVGQLAFLFSGLPADVQTLKMELALTTDLSLAGFYDPTIFTSVFTHDTSTDGNGWQSFSINGNFQWDGTSSLLLQIYHSNPQLQVVPNVGVDETTYVSSFISSGNDRYLKCDGQDEIKIPPAAFSSVSDQISICFWQNGNPDLQPQNGTLFEGVNSLNQRVLNTHLPWENGRVYWDAGYDGGYDRIDKLAATTNYEGKWNHWCFTKNASSGSMKIFLNGVLWHSGTNLDNLMLDIAKFSIGGASGWSNFYNGSIDEFAVFNIELNAASILSSMNRDMDAGHPNWSNLLVYYQFNESDGDMVLDASGNGHHAWMHGNASRIAYKGSELWRNAAEGYSRPSVRIVTGNFISHNEITTGAWIEMIPPVSIVQFAIENYQPVVIGVEYAWEEQNSVTIDVNGVVIDSTLVPAEYTINNGELTYWQTPFEIVDRYELNRFITMYGINLTLGTDGWTWVTDVTDWAPLLRDSVEMEAGNWQELLDLKFVFIEGPPARDIIRVEKVWDGNVGIANFDNQITAKSITKLPGESMWKLATTNTGHGFGSDNNNCGEFCNNIQSVKVNGQEQWSWDIMQECAVNPLYPQGGTWIYDRAGWCPGMNSTTKELELTPHVQTGDSFTIDYDVQYDPYGNYVFFTTLFGYGAVNQMRDPEIDAITAPSDWKINSRWNPMCNKPKFILRNKGSQPLTDINIYFGVEGGSVGAYHWTGNLNFMQSEEVELNYNDPIMWQGSITEDLIFYVTLGLSGDGADDNPSNNHAESHFKRPPVYQYTSLDDNRLIIQLRTNASNAESSYSLYDMNGSVVFEHNNFDAPNTTYLDTVQLNAGCYMFHLRDSGEDGLSFFANSDGNGNCKFDRVSGFDFVSFQANFGKELKHYFYWNTNLVGVTEKSDYSGSVFLYPNPANASCFVNVTGYDRNIAIKIFDQQGKLILNKNIQRQSVYDNFELELSDIGSGLYTVQVTDGLKSAVVKMVKE